MLNEFDDEDEELSLGENVETEDVSEFETVDVTE